VVFSKRAALKHSANRAEVVKQFEAVKAELAHEWEAKCENDTGNNKTKAPASCCEHHQLLKVLVLQ
jgi:hypothetical protein